MNSTIDDLFMMQELERRSLVSGRTMDDFLNVIRRTVPFQILKAFDALESQGKAPVANVVNGCCTGCGSEISLSNYEKAARPNPPADLPTCGKCGRFLRDVIARN